MKAIAEIQKTANRLLAEKESFGLVAEFLSRKAELLSTAESLQELDHFYQSQRNAWEKLQTAYDRFKLNEAWLEKDRAAADALTGMNEILLAEAPYALIKEAEKLIEAAEAANRILVNKAIDKAEERVDARIDQVTQELDKSGASADLRNRCLYPLQQLRGEIKGQASIAHLITIPDRARDMADEAMELIEQAGSEKKGTQVKDKALPKKRRVIRAAELSVSTYLEDQAQVDAFIDALRTELTRAIDEGERVEIR